MWQRSGYCPDVHPFDRIDERENGRIVVALEFPNAAAEPSPKDTVI